MEIKEVELSCVMAYCMLLGINRISIGYHVQTVNSDNDNCQWCISGVFISVLDTSIVSLYHLHIENSDVETQYNFEG